MQKRSTKFTFNAFKYASVLLKRLQEQSYCVKILIFKIIYVKHWFLLLLLRTVFATSHLGGNCDFFIYYFFIFDEYKVKFEIELKNIF